MTTTPKVSVLIVTYNSARFTPRCFEALRVQSMPDFEAIVLDNCSNDGGPKLPDDARFRLISSSVNLGFAAGNNRAASEARSPWIATLNPDAFPEKDWLDQLLLAAQLRKDVTMVGSLQICADDPTLLDGAGDCYHAVGIAWRGLYGQARQKAPSTGEVFGPCAAAALYSAEAFYEVGGFDENFFCYHEDVDLAFRLRLIGGRCIQSAEARVVHKGSGITGYRSDFSTYHGVRNRIWTFAKCMPLPLFVVLFPLHIFVQALLLALSVPERTFFATWRGICDAFCGLAAVMQQRASIQRGRVSTSLDIARFLTWSPQKLFLRSQDVRALR